MRPCPTRHAFTAQPTPLLARARCGAVAVIVAITAVPLMMLTALVIDFGVLLQVKSQLDLTADAANMAAIRTAAAGYAAGQTSATYLAEAQTAAKQWWNAQIGNMPLVNGISPVSTITQSGQTFTAKTSYTAVIQEVIPNLLAGAASTATVMNNSSASYTVNAFATVDFLLDNTSSMMLPATDADLAILQKAEQTWLQSTTNQGYVNTYADGLTGDNPVYNNSYSVSNLPLPATADYCAFACHWSAASTGTHPLDYYGVARQSGETLRFDVVQTATVTAIQQMETLEEVIGEFSVGVYTFGGTSINNSSYLSTVFPETPIDTNSQGITQKSAGAVNAIAALGTISPPVSGDVPDTSIGNALSDTLAITGQGGTGNTAASPKKSLILVTDGIEDDTAPQSIPNTEGPVKPAVCSAIKNAGYTLYILYTPYNSAPVYLPNNMALQPYITGSSSPSVLSALQSCASSSNDVIQATSPAEIQSSIITLLKAAVGTTTQVTN